MALFIRMSEVRSFLAMSCDKHSSCQHVVGRHDHVDEVGLGEFSRREPSACEEHETQKAIWHREAAQEGAASPQRFHD